MSGFGPLNWDVPSVRSWLGKPQNEKWRGEVVRRCLEWLESKEIAPLFRTQGNVNINGKSFCFYGYLCKGNDTPFFNEPSKLEVPHFYVIQRPDGDAGSPHTFCWEGKKYQVVRVGVDMLSRLRDNFRIEISTESNFSDEILNTNVLKVPTLTEEEFLDQFSKDE